MTISAITKQVADEKAAVMMRSRGKAENGNREYDVKPMFAGNKRGWFIMDTQTARAIQAVYGAINEDNRSKFDRIPLPALVSLAWKAVA